MRQWVLVGALVGALGVGASAQTPASAGHETTQKTAGTAGAMQAARGSNLGTVTLTHKVIANGQPLAAGTYLVRLSNDEPQAATGESPNAEKWVEFVRGGKVAGKEVASVIGPDDIGKIAKGPRPKTNGSRVDVLKGGDYVRVWINKGGQNYLINMPPQEKAKG